MVKESASEVSDGADGDQQQPDTMTVTEQPELHRQEVQDAPSVDQSVNCNVFAEDQGYYHGLYQQAPVGYLTLDPAGTIHEVNQAVCSMLGVARTALLNQPFCNLIYPEDRGNFPCHHNQRSACIEPGCCEIRLLCGTNAPFWAYLQSNLTKDQQRLVTIVDINKRKLAELALQESEERFKAVVMAAKDGIILQEHDGKIVTWNRTAERIFGISAQEACGLNPAQYNWQTFHEDGSPFPGPEHPSVATLTTGEPCLGAIMKVVRPDGLFSWISINTSPLFRNHTPQPSAVVISFSDITERKQAMMVLQARLNVSDYAVSHTYEELLVKILDEAEALTESQIGFICEVTDDQLALKKQISSSRTVAELCSANSMRHEAALACAGVWADCIREKKTLIHNDYEALPNRKGLPPGHVPVRRALLVPVIRKNQVMAVLGIGNKPADYTVQDANTVQHLANLAWDTVIQKQSETALAIKTLQLEALNQSLESRVAESVTELRKKDDLLIQQGRLAAMGEMINNIAHQWRQPLNNIGLIVQSLQLAYKTGTLTDEDMHTGIANTLQLLQQMSGTIDDFRNFFSQEKTLQLFSVNDAVKRSLNFMLPALKNSGISVHCEPAEEVTAEGFAGEYVQALLNILTNAKDVLHERRVPNPAITIHILRDNGRSVVLVADNGGGIAEEMLAKVFDPYFTTKSKTSGTGIGLFMSKMILEKNMDGSLTVCNAGQGAEFRIVL